MLIELLCYRYAVGIAVKGLTSVFGANFFDVDFLAVAFLAKVFIMSPIPHFLVCGPSATESAQGFAVLTGVARNPNPTSAKLDNKAVQAVELLDDFDKFLGGFGRGGVAVPIAFFVLLLGFGVLLVFQILFAC